MKIIDGSIILFSIEHLLIAQSKSTADLLLQLNMTRSETCDILHVWTVRQYNCGPFSLASESQQ